MEKAKYLLLSLLCIAFAGCMNGDWDEPSTTPSPWGNNSIEETNVITIAQLKDKYSSVFNASSDQAVQVTEDLQIKGWVTGNDIAGNIYQQVSVQDETGAILIGISQGGLMGYLPLGQQILVNLKGLYVGAYRKQCQIGAPYNGGIGRMDKFTWQEHFKAIGVADAGKLDALVSDFSADMDMFENCAKLMTFRGVTIKDADGRAAFAPNDGQTAYARQSSRPRATRGCKPAQAPTATQGYRTIPRRTSPRQPARSSPKPPSHPETHPATETASSSANPPRNGSIQGVHMSPSAR